MYGTALTPTEQFPPPFGARALVTDFDKFVGLSVKYELGPSLLHLVYILVLLMFKCSLNCEKGLQPVISIYIYFLSFFFKCYTLYFSTYYIKFCTTT